MAAPHAFVTYSIKDAKGAISTMLINFPDSADIAILKIFVRETAEMINNLIKGQIVQAGIGLSVDLAGLTLRATPDPNSDVEEGARFNFSTANGSNTGFRIPTFDEAFFTAGTRLVNLANATVTLLTARIKEGRTQGVINVSPSDDRGSDVVEVASAKESFTSSRG